MNLRSYIPILDWLPKYNSALLKGDLSAGLTVGVMLIPQGMAYAMLAGMPPIYGLYASMIPLIVYAILGTSRQLAVGPVAMISLLIATGVGALAGGNVDQYIALAIMLALLVGGIQLLMGLFRLGFLVNFLSHPVIAGFTSAAALIIGFSQLKHLLGIELSRSHHIHEIIIQAYERISHINLLTLLIGVLGIVLIYIAKKWKFLIPGPLLAVVFSTLAVYSFKLDTLGVKILGEVPGGLPSIGVPELDLNSIQLLLPIALTISFISFMESIAVAKAIEAKHKNYKVVANQELIALGTANIAGSFFQAFPVTGGFSRTAVNNQAGAQTGMAAIISALLIAISLLFLTPLFYYLPNAILASVILVAVFGLIDWKEARYLWKINRPDFWMMMVTFVATLSLGIEQGILIGVLLSLGLIIFQTTQPHTAILGKIPDKPHYKNIRRFPDLEVRKDLLIFRFDARLYFANVSYFKDSLEKRIQEKGEALKAIILDADCINAIDSSGLHALEAIIESAKQRGQEFYFVGVKGPVRDQLYRAGFMTDEDQSNFFLRIQHAIDHFDHSGTQRYKKYNLQTNEENLVNFD